MGYDILNDVISFFNLHSKRLKREIAFEKESTIRKRKS